MFFYLYGGGVGSWIIPSGGTGGSRGGGFYNKPITQPFSQPYAVGGGGNFGQGGGNAGGGTNLANVGTVNGGASFPGSPGNQPGSSLSVPISFRTGPTCAQFGQGMQACAVCAMCGFAVPQASGVGAIIVYENTGT